MSIFIMCSRRRIPWRALEGGLWREQPGVPVIHEEEAAAANFRIYWLIFHNTLRPEEGFSMTPGVTLGASLGRRFWV